MSANLGSMRAIIRQHLEDEFVSSSTEYEWAPDDLNLYIAECLKEISLVSPCMAIEVLTTIANSKILDISSIEDLIAVEKAEYPTGNNPRSLRNIIEIDDDTIEIDTGITPSAGGSGTLTGTVTFASGSAAITGSGTDFDGELEVGYHIRKSTGTRWYRIYSIESDTALTLAEPCRSGDDGADTADVTAYCYETVYLTCRELHHLTESSSTLRPQHEQVLILGVCGRAALAKSRSFIDTVPTGGPDTAEEMAKWGERQWGLYQKGLKQIARRRTIEEYSRG